MRAIWSVRPKCSHRCASLKETPFKTCANRQAHNQKLSRANRYENEMVETYRDLNCSGASPRKIRFSKFPGSGPKLCVLLFFLGNSPKCSQNPGLVHDFSAPPRGQLNWTRPIANSSENCRKFQGIWWNLGEVREIRPMWGKFRGSQCGIQWGGFALRFI